MLLCYIPREIITSMPQCRECACIRLSWVVGWGHSKPGKLSILQTSFLLFYHVLVMLWWLLLTIKICRLRLLFEKTKSEKLVIGNSSNQYVCNINCAFVDTKFEHLQKLGHVLFYLGGQFRGNRLVVSIYHTYRNVVNPVLVITIQFN